MKLEWIYSGTLMKNPQGLIYYNMLADKNASIYNHNNFNRNYFQSIIIIK